MSDLKLVKKKESYTEYELSRIYPGFQYASELFKSLTYNAESGEFTVHKPLPTYAECMDAMGRIYGVATVEFKEFLSDLLMEALTLMKGGPITGKKKRLTKDIEKISNALALVQGIDFPEHSNKLVLEPAKVSSAGPAFILYNIMFYLELMKDYYSDPDLEETSSGTQIVEQLEKVSDELSFLDVVDSKKHFNKA